MRCRFFATNVSITLILEFMNRIHLAAFINAMVKGKKKKHGLCVTRYFKWTRVSKDFIEKLKNHYVDCSLKKKTFQFNWL